MVEFRQTKLQKKKKTANQNKGNIAMRSQVKTSKLTRARENAGDQVAIGYSWNLIGIESGVSFLGQSKSKVKQTQSNSEFLSTSDRNLLYLGFGMLLTVYHTIPMILIWRI